MVLRPNISFSKWSITGLKSLVLSSDPPPEYRDLLLELSHFDYDFFKAGVNSTELFCFELILYFEELMISPWLESLPCDKDLLFDTRRGYDWRLVGCLSIVFDCRLSVYSFSE